jgi:hypothetical protein
MNVHVAASAVAAAIAAGPTAAIAAGPTAAIAAGPTAAQIKQAVQTAEHSKDLWATINICDSRTYPNRLGLRGEIPSIGIATTRMYMTFEVAYRPSTSGPFKLLHSTRQRQYIGSFSNQVNQDGITYTFTPPVVLEGVVTFEWWYHGKMVGSTTRTTTRGHVPDFADPKGYSAKVCTIKAG